MSFQSRKYFDMVDDMDPMCGDNNVLLIFETNKEILLKEKIKLSSVRTCCTWDCIIVWVKTKQTQQ